MALRQIIMKRPFYTFTVLILFSGIQLLGCKKTEDKTEGASVDTQKTVINNTYITEYTTYRTQTEQELARNRDSIAAFAARLKTAKAKLKADLERERLDLERRNAALQAELAEYKDEGQDKWEKFKDGFNRRLDTVRSKWSNLKEKIKHDDD